MRTSWTRGLAVLLFVPAIMGFRACDSEVDVGGSMRDGGQADDGGAAPGYEPCENFACGLECTICPPDDADCVEPAVVNYCQSDGSCQPTPPDCGRVEYDPCEELACGQQCSQCPPDEPECVEPAVVNYCQPDGSCHPTTPECPPGEYDPCEGLTCGQQCSQCPPDEPDCVEPTVVNYCQPDGSCHPTMPACVNCDHTQVACRALPPECDEGEVPSVEGTCWTFECVPAESCQRVRVRCDGVSCLLPEPECADGWRASVIGGCWGRCVPEPWCTDYDPCEGLSCGDSCSQCPPDDRECVEPAVLNYCQGDGSCHPSHPVCEADL